MGFFGGFYLGVTGVTLDGELPYLLANLWKLVAFWMFPAAILSVAKKRWLCDISGAPISIILSFHNSRILCVNASIPPNRSSLRRSMYLPHCLSQRAMVRYLAVVLFRRRFFGVVVGGRYENHWAHSYQYIQTKWACRFPFG